MRTFTSFAMALTVAGSILGTASIASAAAPTGTQTFFYDGKPQVSYTYPDSTYKVGESLKVTHFFYDGQRHVSYSDAAMTTSANTKPTGQFYYDGQFHDTYQ